MRFLLMCLMSAIVCAPTSARALEFHPPMQQIIDDDTCIVINEVVVTGLTGSAKMKDTQIGRAHV